jgi:GT2 family glycosyltransferase
MSDEIGVVVIGRNEGDRLIGCLQSIGCDRIAVVYVDSGSTDDSVSMATRLGASVVRLDLSQPFSAARARNEGFAALTTGNPKIRFVQFIDGDCELDPDWLNVAFESINRHKDVAVVCGRRREKHPAASVYNRLCDLEWDTPVGETQACGGDSLMRADVFRAVDGFRAQVIAGEEPDLCFRMRQQGWKIWRIDAEMTRHDAAMTRFSQWWLRWVRGGYGLMQVSRLHKHSPLFWWRREIRSAIFWAGVVPLLIGSALLVSPIAIAGVLIYPLQIYRLASHRGGIAAPYSLTYALFMMLAQFPVSQGILKFQLHRLFGSVSDVIEYK